MSSEGRREGRGVRDLAAISTVGLTKHFGRVVALDSVDLEVRRGEIFGFLGPNGSGKTTTIRLLLGLIRPTQGAAWIMGIPVSDVARAHQHVSYVPGDVALWQQLTGAETLDLLGNIGGKVDAAYRQELVELWGLDPSKTVRSLSKGNRQKIALIAAFMGPPDVLLLDEPTAGLDPLMEEQFQIVARDAAERGQTIFLSSHILDEVQDLCSRVGILRTGRLVEVATLDELRRIGSTIVEVVVEGAIPALDDVAGVTAVERLPGIQGGIRVSVSGSPSALLARLGSLPVVRLRTEEPSLEEIFLTYLLTIELELCRAGRGVVDGHVMGTSPQAGARQAGVGCRVAVGTTDPVVDAGDPRGRRGVHGGGVTRLHPGLSGRGVAGRAEGVGARPGDTDHLRTGHRRPDTGWVRGVGQRPAPHPGAWSLDHHHDHPCAARGRGCRPVGHGAVGALSRDERLGGPAGGPPGGVCRDRHGDRGKPCPLRCRAAGFLALRRRRHRLQRDGGRHSGRGLPDPSQPGAGHCGHLDPRSGC